MGTKTATHTSRIGHAVMVLLSLALAALGVACSGGTVGSSRACHLSDDCAASQVCIDGRCRAMPASSDAGEGMDAGSPTDLIALSLMPDNPVIQLPDDPSTLSFTVLGRQRDGSTRTLTSGLLFTIDNASIGSINLLTGLFTASGSGGSATVRVQLGGAGPSASTTLTVNWHGTVLGSGVSPTDPDVFGGATPSTDASTAPAIDYPLASAVMPRNVYPPKVMWTPHHPSPTADDLWHVRLARPHAVLDGYFRGAAGFDDSWQLPTDSWPAMAGSDVGQPIQVTVEVSSGGVVYQSAMTDFRTVDAVLGGSVYYWSPPQARLMRLDVQTASLVDFLPHTGDTCIGCHAVSRDGRRLIAVREPTETVTAFDITRDLTADPAPNLFAVHYDVRRCESFNPDSTRVVAGDCGANPTSLPFNILDMSTGAEVSSLAGQAGDGFDPEWSPDGSTIAYTNRGNDLALTPVMADGSFGSSGVVHSAASSPEGAVDWHPSWTPDSHWIVYQHGDTRRTDAETGGACPARGARCG